MLTRKLNFHHQEEQLHAEYRNNPGATHESSNESSNYRQKFYEIQDRLMEEKKKSIYNFEKSSLLKESIIEFL
jgi:hypothetical protein